MIPKPNKKVNLNLSEIFGKILFALLLLTTFIEESLPVSIEDAESINITIIHEIYASEARITKIVEKGIIPETAYLKKEINTFLASKQNTLFYLLISGIIATTVIVHLGNLSFKIICPGRIGRNFFGLCFMNLKKQNNRVRLVELLPKNLIFLEKQISRPPPFYV